MQVSRRKQSQASAATSRLTFDYDSNFNSNSNPNCSQRTKVLTSVQLPSAQLGGQPVRRGCIQHQHSGARPAAARLEPVGLSVGAAVADQRKPSLRAKLDAAAVPIGGPVGPAAKTTAAATATGAATAAEPPVLAAVALADLTLRCAAIGAPVAVVELAVLTLSAGLVGELALVICGRQLQLHLQRARPRAANAPVEPPPLAAGLFSQTPPSDGARYGHNSTSQQPPPPP